MGSQSVRKEPWKAGLPGIIRNGHGSTVLQATDREPPGLPDACVWWERALETSHNGGPSNTRLAPGRDIPPSSLASLAPLTASVVLAAPIQGLHNHSTQVTNPILHRVPSPQFNHPDFHDAQSSSEPTGAETRRDGGIVLAVGRTCVHRY